MKVVEKRYKVICCERAGQFGSKRQPILFNTSLQSYLGGYGGIVIDFTNISNNCCLKSLKYFQTH